MSINFEKLKLRQCTFLGERVKLTVGFNLEEVEESLLY